MSKERQATRAQRQAAAEARAEELRVQREKAAADRARRERRALMWRRMRLWHSGQRRRDTRERFGSLGAVALLVLVAVFVATRSVSAVLGTALIVLISTPVLWMLFFDRRRK